MSRSHAAAEHIGATLQTDSDLTCGCRAQIVVKGRLGLDRAADYLEELRAHSRSRAVSVALLSPSPDTDPDDLDHLERVRADVLLEAMAVSCRSCHVNWDVHPPCEPPLLSQQGVRTISQDTIHVAAGVPSM